MILVSKLHTMACSYTDGAYSKEQLSQFQWQNKVVERPSLLEVLSYTFYCCGCVTGPHIDYKEFIDHMGRRNNFENVPSTFLPSLKKAGQSISKNPYLTF